MIQWVRRSFIKRLIRFSFILAPLMFCLRVIAADIPRCILQKPVFIGASVTSATAAMTPMYTTAVRSLAFSKGIFWLRSFGYSPAQMFLLRHGPAFSSPLNLAAPFTNQQAHLGSSQIFSLLYGRHQDFWSQATILIGIDAFYWDAVRNSCEDEERPQKAIRDLVLSAKQKQIPLILGNVPDEDAELVLVDSQRLGVPACGTNRFHLA